MGVFGYEEYENDDFLDFVGDDTSDANLLRILTIRNDLELWEWNAEYLAGILNKISPVARETVSAELKSIALRYLERSLQSELLDNFTTYRNKNDRIATLRRQIQRLS